MQIEPRGAHAGQRPLLLVAPDILAHHEDPDRRFRVEPVLHTLQVIVVPMQMELAQIGRHLRSKVHVAVLRIAANAVSPGSNQQFLPAARMVRAGQLPHVDEVRNRLVREVVIPAGEMVGPTSMSAYFSWMLIALQNSS